MRSRYSKNLFTTSILLFFILISCKDNSSSSSDITVTITNGTAAPIELNQCNIGSGSLATEFLFLLEYQSSDEIDIDGVEFDLTWSDGDGSQNIFENSFSDDNNILDFDWCFRYGSTEWFEIDVKILAEDEEIESNEYTIRVDRPEGAN